MNGNLAQIRPRLSVVIPVYNEVHRLETTLRLIATYLAGLGYPVEIIVADDGSTDGTFDLVRSIGSDLEIDLHALRYADNRGKGYALKVGFAHAVGQRILFTDIDLATPIEEHGNLDSAMDAGCDIAIGSRKMIGSEVAVHQAWVREQMGKVFTRLVRLFLADVSDATCGFKMFRRETGQELFSSLRIDGWAFDAEILFLADRRGHSVQEVPVHWEDQTGTKVRMLRDAWVSFAGLIRIVSNGRAGLYERPDEILPEFETWSNADASSPHRVQTVALAGG